MQDNLAASYYFSDASKMDLQTILSKNQVDTNVTWEQNSTKTPWARFNPSFIAVLTV